MKLKEELDKISAELPATINWQNPPNELLDADFITKQEQRNYTPNNIFSDILLKDNLKSNTSKTEHTQIEHTK